MTKLVDSKYVWWFFVVAIVFVYFYGLGIPLVGPDEPRYAQVAREMFELGDWITPTLGGFDWLEKPALLYWLQIISYMLFGVGEFAARFGSALFGLGTVASMWFLGRYANFKNERSESIGFANLLALITATSLSILVFARGASFDIVVTFPLTASLVGFFVANRAGPEETRKRVIGLSAFYFFAGLAVLAKGLIGLVFPFGIVGLYYLLSRRLPSRQFFQSVFWGMLLLLMVAAIWNVPMYIQHGWKFIDEFYIQHHFQRYTSNKYQHPQPFYFYFWVLPLMTLPWLPWLVGGIVNWLREFFGYRERDSDPAESEIFLFAASWAIVPLIFFSASGSKLPGYILPAVPAALIAAALCIKRSLRNTPSHRWLVFAIALTMLALIPILISTAGQKYIDHESVKRLVEVSSKAGFGDSRVIGFRNVSHNAEFYAAGRLVRQDDGKQQIFYDASEVAKFAAVEMKPILVLGPVKDWEALSTCSAEKLDDNGDLFIAVVKPTSIPCQ